MEAFNKYSIIEFAYRISGNIEFIWDRSIFRFDMGIFSIDVYIDTENFDDVSELGENDNYCLDILKDNIQQAKLYLSCYNLLGDGFYNKDNFYNEEPAPIHYCGRYVSLFRLLRTLSPTLDLNKLELEFYFFSGVCLYGGPECDDPNESGIQCAIEPFDFKGFIFLLEKCIDNSVADVVTPLELSFENDLNAGLGITILPSNTKTRRLGYLKIIANMFDKVNSIPKRLLNKKVEKYCLSYSQEILELENSKGIVVETKTGSSVKPYVELADKLKFIDILSAVGTIGKTGKTYNILKRELNDNFDNIFKLTMFDTFFILEQLIRNDYVFIFTLIEQLYLNSSTNLKSLRLSYQNFLLNNVRNISNYNCNSSHGKKTGIDVIEKRIQSWEKPYVYTEHIIMPRINWLNELGLVDITNSTMFKITDRGEKLFHVLCAWIENNTVLFSNPEKYCNNNFMKSACHVYNLCGNNNVTLSYIDDYLERAFILFKTIAPNRVTFSHAVLYIKYMMFFEKNEILDVDYIREYLYTSNNYIVKYQDAYGDGYIQHKK